MCGWRASRSRAGVTVVAAYSVMMYVKVAVSVSVAVEAIGQEGAISAVLVYTAVEDIYLQ